MPNVGGKKFPYTAAGQAAAKKYKKKMQGGKAGGLGGSRRRGPGTASPSGRGPARPGMRRGPGAAGPSRRKRPARPMKKRGTRY